MKQFLGRIRNSTIIPKKKRLDCGCFDFAFSKNRCKQHASIESFNKRMEAATEQMIQEEDLSDIISDLDRVFSQYIRLKYADKNGMVECYTSGIKKHWTLMQCGHFVSRSHLYLRWDSRNCRPQSAEDNEYKHGNLAVFREKLNREQFGLADILDQDRNIIYKPGKTELKQLISEYSQKVKSLKKRITTT